MNRRCALTLVVPLLLAASGEFLSPPTVQAASRESANGESRLPLLDEDEAWRRLPKVTKGIAGRPLPNWARILAGPLPHTTARMLELDDLYRNSQAFDPELRAIMRWTAARANRCQYSQLVARLDLERTGAAAEALSEQAIASRPPAHRAAIAFAQKLTLDASKVTDEEVAELVQAFGEPAVVAMVLQIAHANFQDRLLLALNVEMEPEGPLPPLSVAFVQPSGQDNIAADRPKATPSGKPLQPPAVEPEWGAVPLSELVQGMSRQRERSGRISVPLWSDVLPRLPAGMYSAERPVRIRWSLVVLGHQPQLGQAWLNCLRTFSRESNQDQVLQESMFWVITRSIDCFY